VVVIVLHRGVFPRAVQAFHLTMGPAMVGVGETGRDAVLLADAIEN
jgi:hypothetical protein